MNKTYYCDIMFGINSEKEFAELEASEIREAIFDRLESLDDIEIIEAIGLCEEVDNEEE